MLLFLSSLLGKYRQSFFQHVCYMYYYEYQYHHHYHYIIIYIIIIFIIFIVVFYLLTRCGRNKLLESFRF